MDRRAIRVPAAVAAVVLTAGLGAGCGMSERKTDLVAGKTMFVQRCGSCHVLSRAGTKGTQGPNLDAAFGPSRGDGLGEDTVEGVVRRQIAFVRRSSIMPANLVEGQDAADVSAYVAKVAGQPGEDEGELAKAGAPKVSNKPIVARGGKLQIDADPTGALAFASTRAESPAGALEFVMANPSDVQHNIALNGPGGRSLGVGDVVGKGADSTFRANVSRGSYEFLCTVPGHAEGGMKGTLTVK
jgi:mono/diheme cytochrome c family protein/plastocyanin